jgi:hypothetical protein
MDGLLQPAIASGHYPETKSQSGKRIFGGKEADVIKNRCSPVSLILFIAIGVFLFCAVSAQAASGPGGATLASSNGVTAAVRSVQPAVSGLFQVHTPRVWADALDESGQPVANGVPDFLETWSAFTAREDSAILKNAYAFRTIDGLGHEILYAGVQRASAGGPSKVVFEFNQKPGARLLGDLQIDAEIDGAGNLGTVRFQSYSEGKGSGKFIQLAILSGEGCNDSGTACIVANGALLEVGVNLSQLLNGAGDRFKGIQITTPEDSVVGIFSLTPVVGGAGSCVKEVGNLSKANCTANDIQLTAIVPGTLVISNNTCSIDGQGNLSGDVTFSATGQFVLTTQTRYDVGLYIDTNGDPENDTARTGQCTRFAFSNDDGVNAEGAGDADSCGDLTQAIAAAPNGRAMPFTDVTIKCVDKDDDGKVDVYHCETWSQNEDEINCTSSTSVKAGTSSKCNCGILAGACIPTPNSDECLENVCVLRCSNDEDQECTIGGDECTAPGFCADTLITQNKANGSACGDQTSGDCKAPDTCVDGECETGFQPTTTTCRPAVDVCDLLESCTGDSADCPADDKAPAGTACGDPSSGLCDNPDTCDGSGSCQSNNASDTTTCRAAVDVCDVLESCDDGACPADEKAPEGTACGDQTSGLCDDPNTCDGSGTCQDNNKPDTTTCRPSANGCDQLESCENGVCPDDVCRDDLPPDAFP